MRQLIFLVFSLAMLTGCEKEITLDLVDKSGNIVIEGNITDQAGPYYVRITKTVAFTEENRYPPIEDAVVTITDGLGHEEILHYESNGLYKTNDLVGTPGNTYTLSIQAEGVEYTAKSTMPQPVTLDSLTQDSFSIGGETIYGIIPNFTDPGELGNRYLFIITVNDRITEKAFQTFSDNTNNGMANERSLRLPREDDEDDKVGVGDAIHVEMQCIDQDTYTYYNALIQISGSGGPGGSVTPANPPSNISNGALGHFSAHTVASGNIIIN